MTEELVNLDVVKDLKEIEGVGHRVVHGGDIYKDSVVIDDNVLSTIEELSPLAPLHNPANLVGIQAFLKQIPSAVQVACFDTAFHQTIEEDRYLYAVPNEWYTKYGVRKYGFHGMSHKYVSHRVSDLLDKKYCNIIVCHLGNGGSISAVRDGRCIDTTMGSGMLAVSEISSDFRDIEAKISERDHKAILAHYLFVNSVVSYIAKYYVELGGADAICFTAGVGENSPHVRRMVIDRLACLGLKLDRKQNEEMRLGKEGMITREDSSVPCFVIPTDEEVMIARDTYSFLN